MTGTPYVTAVRAFTVRGGDADYHDQGDDHWIDGPIATPMSRYPAYRAHRRSFVLNVLGTLVVEVEASGRRHRLRRHHGWGAGRLDRGAAPGPVRRGGAGE